MISRIVKIAILILIFLSPTIHAEQDSVTLYGIHKTIIIDNSKYKNRFDYSEVSYVAKFESANSDTYQVSGFYNGLNSKGEHFWEIRFMPNKPGYWKYQIKNNLGETVRTGEFEVTEKPALTNNHGHIKVDDNNPKYLIHEDGTPHYWIGGKWISANDYGPKSKDGFKNIGVDQRTNVAYGYKTNQQLLEYLDVLVEYKHNGTLLKIGQYPLEMDRISWDLGWIQRGEWLVEEALKRGINVQVNLFDTWSRDQNKYFSFNTKGTNQPFDVWNDGDDHLKQNYLRTIISRFASFSNVYWELGNELEHKPNCGTCFVKLANDKYIHWIKKFDPYQLPIGLSGDIWKSANVDIGFLHQTNELPDDSMKRPVIMNELVRYDLEQSFIEKTLRKLFNKSLHSGLWHDDAINSEALRFIYRRTFWKVFTLGGSGSSEATWLYIDNELSENVLAVMKDHMRLSETLQRFLPELNTMKPIDSFIVSSEENENISTRGNKNIFISYFDAGYGKKKEESTIDIQAMDKDYNAIWFNPSKGTTISQQNLQKTNNQLIRPAYIQDLVLILEPRGT